MRKNHRILWIIISIMVLVSMIMFSILPYLNAAEVTPIGTTTQTEEQPAAPYTAPVTEPTNAAPILGPGAASVTATVPETEFNRPKQITYWIAAFKNIDPYVSLLVGSLIVVLVLGIVAFVFWKKNKKAETIEQKTQTRS